MSRNRTLWITLGLIALLLWGFAEVAAEVMEKGTPAIDRALEQRLHNPSGHNNPAGPPWLEKVVRDIDGLGGFFPLTYFGLSTFIYLLIRHRYRAAGILALTIGGGGGMSLLMKYLFNRPRPEVVNGLLTSSFPSGHSLMSLIVYLTLGAFLAGFQPTRFLKVFILLMSFVLPILIGISRVYLGTHWPSDVLAGWLIGLAWSLACWLIALRLQERGKMDPDVPIPGKL